MGDDLHPFTPSAPTIGRMTALIRSNDVRRVVHPRFASQRYRAPQGAGAATLTLKLNSEPKLGNLANTFRALGEVAGFV